VDAALRVRGCPVDADLWLKRYDFSTMTDPIRNAKPVGPAPPPGPQPAQPPQGAQPGPGQASQQNPPGGPRQPYVRAYSWSTSGRSIPWLAVLLVVLGVGLLLELLVPGLSFVSLAILAIGIAFTAVWLLGKVVGATMPALVFVAWGLSEVASDLGYLSGDGWTSLFVGAAFLIGWGLGRYQKTRRDWALVLGLVFAVIGLADVSDALALNIDMFVVIPLVMIGAGIFLILRNRMPAR
jgi:hypothetical protein